MAGMAVQYLSTYLPIHLPTYPPTYLQDRNINWNLINLDDRWERFMKIKSFTSRLEWRKNVTKRVREWERWKNKEIERERKYK